MSKFAVILVAAIAISAVAAKDTSREQVAVARPAWVLDEQGFPYFPIYCQSSDECRCREAGGGAPQCSLCPDDGGSGHKYNNVCWCKDIFHWEENGYGRNECNPLKGGGPQRPGDFDSDGVEYRPLRCWRADQCECSAPAYPLCSRCPRDFGSKNRYKNVCWCNGINLNKYGHYGSQCNQFKPSGPRQIY